MPEEKEDKKVTIGLAVAAGLGGLAGLLVIFALLAQAAAPPPPIIYTCPYCGAEFTTEAELLAHIAAQHPEEPPEVWYTCPHCGATFTTEEELLAHIELEHPEVPPPEGVAEFAYVSPMTVQDIHFGQEVDGIYERYFGTVKVNVQNIGGGEGYCSLKPQFRLWEYGVVVADWADSYLGYTDEFFLAATLAPGETVTFYAHICLGLFPGLTFLHEHRFIGDPGEIILGTLF